MISPCSPEALQAGHKVRARRDVRREQKRQAVICLTIEKTPLSADAVAAVFIKFKNRLADECNHKIGGVL